MELKIKASIFLLFCAHSILAKEPIWSETFDGIDRSHTVNGVVGQAIDWTQRSSNRQVLEFNNPTKSDRAFSVMLWAKADGTALEEYTLLSAITPLGKAFQGWKIQMASTGAWQFIANDGKNTVAYTATAPRQTIRDGNWHHLAFTFEPALSEFAFYFDGKQVARYNAAGLGDFRSADTLVVGGQMDSERYHRKWDWDTYWDTFNGSMDEVRCYSDHLSAAEVAAYFTAVTGHDPTISYDPPGDLLKLTVFNIWHGGKTYGKETGRNTLIDMLQEIGSDVYFLVETYGSGAEIADALDYYLYLISSNLSIISRYPFEKTYPLSRSFNSGGAQLRLPNGQLLNAFNVWLDWQPAFHTNTFDNREGRSLSRYLEEEDRRRGGDIRGILHDIKPQLEEATSIPLIVAGDFNSGSHLDHTEATRSIHHGYLIPWPASKAMADHGFTDSYRQLHPDPLQQPGLTFSTVHKTWMNERIDFIYYQGKSLRPISSTVVNSHPVRFPSDHAAVTTVFKIGEY